MGVVPKKFSRAYARVSSTNSTIFQPPHITKTSYGPVKSVDSISRDGPDTPIYIIHYKKQNNSEQVKL